MDFVSTYLRSLRRLAREKRAGAFLMTAALALAFVQLFEPVWFGRVVDGLARREDFAVTLVTWAGLGVTGALINVALAIVADRLAHRQRMAALVDGFAKVISLNPRAAQARGAGKLTRVILAGADQVFFLWLTLFREHLTSFLALILLVPMASTLDHRLATLLFGLAALYAWTNWFVIRRTHKRQARVETMHQEMAGQMLDVIGNVAVVQSFDRVHREIAGLAGLGQKTLGAQYPVLNWWGVLNTITRVSSTLALMVIVGCGSYLVTRGEVTAGQVVTFAGFSSFLIARLDQISSFLGRAVGQAPALRALFDLMDEPGEDAPAADAADLERVRGRVTFEHVDFSFGPGAAGVRDLDFDVEPGQTIALVGPSGAGKTTCLQLLQGVIAPTRGRILIDDRDAREFRKPELRAAVAAVFQEPQLFNRSIAENVRVGRPTAGDREVRAATELAQAHDFVAARPGGYDFVVGERGAALSGGERQRVALARAILKDAPILVLDEATSALDNETETRVQAAIERLSERRTTFVIAHRLSTIVNADRILVFEAGRVVQAGTFGELAGRPGLFRRLLDAGQLSEPKADAPGARASL